MSKDTSYCDICNIIPTRLYVVGKKKVCRRCKKLHDECGKFIRKKVEHDYVEAQKLLTRFHKEVFGDKNKRCYKSD